MRKKLISISCVLLVLLPARPASAQANGPYAGAQGGWERMDARNPESALGTVAIGGDRQTFTTGVFVGYDRQVAPRIVLGVEGGVDWSADDAVVSTSGTGLVSVDPRWSIDLTTRAGYLLGPTTLTYVRGGYTNARVETNLTGATTRLWETENRNGWLVGAGIERLFLQHISGRLEYLYSDLGEGDGTFGRHRILAGIAYRF